MTNKPVGGRGKKAPYTTAVVRIPEPLVPLVNQLADTYRTMCAAGQITQHDLLNLDIFSTSYSAVPQVEAVEGAKRILKQKKSARVSLIKLLQVIYPSFNGEI